MLLTFLAICFFATGGVLVKLSSLPPIATAFYRILFSFPILLLFLKKSDFYAIDKKSAIFMLIAGAFLGFDLLFFNISFHLTTMANANLLGNLTPITVIPLSYLLYKNRPSSLFILGLIITLTGLLVLMMGKVDTNVQNFHGDFFAFITSIFYGFFLLMISAIAKNYRALLLTFFSGIGAVSVLFFAMIFVEGFHFPSTLQSAGILVCLALISQVLGQGILSHCLTKIDINLASVLVLIQPVIAAIYGYFIFKEHLSLQEIVGIFIVLTGIFFAKRGNETGRKLVLPNE
ncbi:MAG: DMT family transporter [Spirochaetia bacterium]